MSSSTETSWSSQSDLSSAASPPSYTVQERSDGELVNHTLGVVWPNRPGKGHHSMSAYKQRRKLRRARRAELLAKHDTSEESEVTLTASYSSATSSNCEPDFPPAKVYPADSKQKEPGTPNAMSIEVSTPTDMAKKLNPVEFRLYYPLPSENSIDVPAELPLTMAYKCSSGKSYNFPIETTNGYHSVIFNGSLMFQSFSSLEDLSDYYKIYAYCNETTKNFDVFPVWEL